MHRTRACWLPIVLLPLGCGPADSGTLFAPSDGMRVEDPDEVGPALRPPRFVDGTGESGLDWSASRPTAFRGPQRRVAGGGAVAADLDGDDVVDLLLTSVNGDNALFMGLGDGRFERRPDSGLEEGIWTFGGAAADLDGDGLREVFLFDDHQLRQFDNLGGGRFDERPPPLTASDEEWVVGAGLVDYDGDGFVDVYAVLEGDWTFDGTIVGGEDRLLGGGPGGEFEDRTGRLGQREDRIGQGFVVTWLDVDSDGDLDAYVVNEKGNYLVPNRLFLQDEGWFVEASAEFALDLRVDGMGVAQADLGHDGTLELAVTDTDGWIHLLRMEDGVAVSISEASNAVPPPGPEYFASWATQLEDLDNDGEADLLTAWGQFEDRAGAEPGRVSLALWRQDGFEDFTPQLPELLNPTWRSVLPVDVNDDGQLDWLQTGLAGAPALILGVPTGGHWLDVQLQGPPGNRDGLGAMVYLLADGVVQQRCLGAGISGSHSSKEPVVHFGLGRVDRVDEVRVRWPDGSETVVEEPAADGRLLVRKG